MPAKWFTESRLKTGTLDSAILANSEFTVSFQWCWFKQKIHIVVFYSLWGLKIKYFSLLKKLLLDTEFVDLKPEAEPEVSETHFSFLM